MTEIEKLYRILASGFWATCTILPKDGVRRTWNVWFEGGSPPCLKKVADRPNGMQFPAIREEIDSSDGKHAARNAKGEWRTITDLNLVSFTAHFDVPETPVFLSSEKE